MSAKKRPTIYDLEKATGLSRGTISRAFNAHAEVNAATREAILKKAAEIGYTPHPGARSMTLGKTGRWGLLVPHMHNPYYAELMEAMDRQARLRGTVMLVGLSHNDAKLEADVIKHWSSGETDGIVVSSGQTNEYRDFLLQLRQREYPLVFMYDRPTEDFDMVTSDIDVCLDRAMRHLVSFGHRRIAYLGQNSPRGRLTSPFRAYRRYHEQNGLEMDPELQYFGSYDYQCGADAWQRWRSLTEPPTAVVCFNDITAAWLMYAAKADGLEIPRDLSIIGNDDTTEALRSGLTTVRTDPVLIAKEIFDMLYDPLPLDTPGRFKMVKGDFILRDTVMAPRPGPLPRR